MTRPVAQIVSLVLPVPPSVNKAFASARAGSKFVVKTAAYGFWLREVQGWFGAGKGLPILAPGPYGMFLTLPRQMRGDIDNRIKLTSDILKRPNGTSWGLGVVEDDGDMKALYVEQTRDDKHTIDVIVTTMAAWPELIRDMMELRT